MNFSFVFLCQGYQISPATAESCPNICYFGKKDLILARVGLFDLEGNDMTVCPKHRAALGKWWRPILKYYHPLHGNRRRKSERGASLQMCKEIMTKW